MSVSLKLSIEQKIILETGGWRILTRNDHDKLERANNRNLEKQSLSEEKGIIGCEDSNSRKLKLWNIR